jgi:hypothetical protein
MKAYGGEEAYFHSFLTSVVGKLSGQLYALVDLSPGKEPPLLVE